MANNTSNVTLNVDDKGSIKSLIKDAEKLHKTLKAAAAYQSGVHQPGPVKAARAAAQAEAGRESGLARGIGGQTGASSRDFAKQAEGLGGLVRLYATVAANIFAVTAAATALSNAMDTTNIVKGLDQLGAASGRNLGTLSKNLYVALDGAVSLREAMEATVKASTAGLNSQQILNMGEAAKKASQALGLNMTDALSRLSRGISKLEPELLDELGIYVKIEQATTEYARSIGKTAGALTEFERRQAFATAVLDQANKKFASINIDANPYSKLVASLANVSQQGLELVNKVLGPIAKVLSESPTALSLVIAGLATMLVKQAIPALGNWRDNLHSAAQQAAKDADALKNSFGEKFVFKINALFNIPELEKQLAKAKADVEKLSQSVMTPTAMPVGLRKATTLTSQSITEDARLKSINTMLDKRLEKEKVSASLSADAIKRNQEEIQYLKMLQAETQRLIALEKARLAQTGLEANIAAAKDKALLTADKPSNRWWDTEQVAMRQIEASRIRYEKMAAVSQAAETTRLVGIRGAWTELNKTIAEKGITGMAKWSTLAQGGIAAVTTRLAGLASGLGTIGMIVGAAIAAFQVLDAIFSKNEKQSAEAAKSFEALGAATDFVSKVSDELSKKDPLASISTESINARANALNDLVANFSTAVTAMGNKLATDGWWEELKDKVAYVFNKDDATVYSKQFAASIKNALSIATGSSKISAATKIQEILGVDPENIEAVFKKLSASPLELQQAVGKITPILKQLGMEMGNTASRAQQLDDAFKNAAKTYDGILVSSIPTDPIAKLGIETMNVARQMTDALRDPITSLQQLAATAGDTSRLRLFGNFGIELAKQADSIKKNVSAVTELDSAIDTLKNSEKKLAEDRKKFVEYQMTEKTLMKTREAAEKTASERFGDPKAIESVRKLYEQQRTEIQKTLDPLILKFRQSNLQLFFDGAKQIETAIGAGFAKAALTLKAGYAALLGDSGIEVRADIEKRSIDIEIQRIQANNKLIESQDKLREAIEKASEEARKGILEGKSSRTTEEEQELSNINARLAARKKLGSTSSLRDLSDLVAAGGKSEDPETLALGELAANRMASAQAKMANSAKIADELAKQQVIELNKQKDIALDLVKLDQERNSRQQSLLSLQQELLGLDTNSQQFMSEENLSLKERLSDQALYLSQKREQLELDRARKAVSASLESDDPKIRASAQKELSRISEAQRDLLDKEKSQKEILNRKNFLDRVNNEYKLASIQQELAKQAEDFKLALTKQSLAKQEEALSTGEALGTISGVDLVAAKAELESAREKLKLQESLNNLRNNQAKLDAQYAKDSKSTKDVEALKVLEEQYKSSSAANALAIAQETELSNIRLKNIDLIGEMNKKLAIQKDIGETLETVFGNFGKTFADSMFQVVNSLDKMAGRYEEIQRLEKAANNKDIPEEDRLEIIEQLNKAQAKNSKEQIKDMASIAGATKKMFSEKTAAYKVLNAVEKALHVFRLAAMVKEAVTAVSTTAPVVAANIAKAASGGVVAIIDAMKGIPTPYNFIAGAAMAAFVASILGKSIGRGGGVPKGVTAEEQQKVQGTGQQYVNGELVNRAGGVLGDPTAKAKSLETGISLIEEHSFKTMEFSNDMLENLKGIKKNTEGLSSILLQAGLNLKYIRPDGTKNVNSSVSYGVPKDIQMGVNAMLTPIMGSLFANREGIGIGAKLFGADSVFGKTEAKVIKGLFGSIDTEVLNTGIQAFGTLAELAINTFETIKTTENKKFLGISYSKETGVDRKLGELPELGAETLQAIFVGMADTVKSAAQALGKDTGLVSSITDAFQFTFEASLMGLKPEEIVEAITSELSVTFNTLAEKVLPEFKKFRKPGEEFGDTIIRLARDVQVSALAMESAGLNIGDISKYSEAGEAIQSTIVRVTQSYIDAAGGLDALVSKTNYFAENFLTEAQRLAPVQARVTAEMKRLGLESVTTREQFAQAVNQAAAMGPSGQQLFIGLLNVAEGFAAVTEPIEEVKNQLADLKKRGKDLADEYAKLTLSEEAYLALKRAELQTAEERAQFDTNANLEKQINIEKQSQSQKKKLADLDIDALRAQGLEQEALTLLRTREIDLIKDEGNKALQRQIYAREDEIRVLQKTTSQRKSLADLDIEALKAQGLDQQALTLLRTRELETLDPANRLLQEQIYAREDEVKILQKTSTQRKTLSDLDLDILRAQGRGTEALQIQRANELNTLDPANRALQELIYIREDELRVLLETKDIKKSILDQDVEMLNVLGLSQEALNLERTRELETLDPANRLLKQMYYARQDEISRMREYMTISEELFSAELESLREQGKAEEALQLERARELSKLDPANRAIKQLVYARQDEVAAMRRMKEISDELVNGYRSAVDALKAATDRVNSAKQAVSDKLFAAQDKLADLKNQREEEANNLLKASIDKLKDFAKALKDFINELATGDLSSGSGASKTELLRQEFESLRVKAARGDEESMNKIQDVASKYLEAARDQSSTNLDYARIYGYVINSLDILSDSAQSLAKKKERGLKTPQDKMVELQQEINKAQAEVNQLTKIANSIGASTQRATEDILAEYRAALAEQRTAEQDLAIYKNALVQLKIDANVKTTADKVSELVTDYNTASGKLQTAQEAIGRNIGNLGSNITNLGSTFVSVGQNIVSAIVSAATRPPPPAAPGTVGSRPQPGDRVRTGPSVRQFAEGGFHDGGARIVGEVGPELEVTPPSRIINSRQTRKLLDNSELLEEMRAMRREMERLRYVSEKTEINTKRTKDTLVRVTRDGDSLVTTSS